MPKIIRWSSFFARLFLGGVFAYSGYTKLIEPVENFRGILADYAIIPYVFVPWIAVLIPWAEFAGGVFLILGFVPRLSALVLSALAASFIILLLAVKVSTGKFPADCGCLGEGSFIHLSGKQIIILDFFDFVIGLGLFRIKNHPLSLDKWLRQKGISKS